MPNHGPILTFGEALWDCLPAGLFMGGAPLNVAYHASQLGADARVVSSVGKDFLGEEIIRRLDSLGVDTRHLHQVDAPTGTVQVSLSNGSPSYDIILNVAWDQIGIDDSLRQAASQASALIFGSLAQRSEANRASLQELRSHCSDDCIQAFDVNLRPPFDDAKLIRELAQGCDLLKLNDEECTLLLHGEPPNLEHGARDLAQTYGIASVAITAGAQGAGLLHHGQWHWTDGQSITVADTVGAGDSFMAALICGLVNKNDPHSIITEAARLAEFVASSTGPTPQHQ